MSNGPGWIVQEWAGDLKPRKYGYIKLYYARCNGCQQLSSTPQRQDYFKRYSGGCRVCAGEAKRGCQETACQKKAYKSHRTNAIGRGLIPLGFEAWLHYLHLPCHYCGAVDSNTCNYEDRFELKYNGIDRVDSSLGYVPGNCVPCCRICNTMKMDLSIEEFISHIERIKNHVKPS